MKKRLAVYLFACLLVGLLSATFITLRTSSHSSTMISVSFYPESDADQVITSINDLHLKNVMATKVTVGHGLIPFLLQTILSTLSIALAASLVLIIYASLCRAFKFGFKK